MKDNNPKNKSSIFKYLNPKNVATEVHRCGYEFSMSSYIKYLLIMYAGIGILAYLYKLQIIPIIIILIVAAFFVPIVFLTTYHTMYEQKKFDDLTNYMELMLYSFKRNSKILTSLEDTLTLFSEGSEMHNDILKAIDYIKNSNTTGDIFQEALSIIEEDFGCKRLSTLHNFLVKVERSGGDFDLSVDILLNDRKLWVDRVYELERDKKNVKIKVTMGIAISFVVGLMAVYIIPENMDIPANILSQIVTTFVFLCNMAVWYVANRKLSGSLIDTRDAYTWEEIKYKYNLVFHEDAQKKSNGFLIAGLLLLPVAVFLYFKIGAGVALITLLLIYIIITQPKRQYKLAFKKVRNEVEKAFPDWLLSMSLLLQTDNVHVAIRKSKEDAPEILKEELDKLDDGIIEYPNAVEPYVHFMDKLDISDVLSAMKMLYSMAEFGTKDISKQIGALVERNSTMTDKAERLRAEDYLAAMGFFVLAPMVTGVLKLVTDLALIVFYVVNIINVF